MHLYLIRHGQSEENTRQWDGSNTNSPLTALGQQQAAAVAAWLKDHIPLDVLYASTMQRTRQTVAPIAAALGIVPIFQDRLREVGNALSDGSAFPDDQLPRYRLEVWGSIDPYEDITENGGENWMQFRARIGGFLAGIIKTLPAEHTDYHVGVVCHGGVIEGFFEHIFHKGPRSIVVVHSSNTGITHIEYLPQHGMPDWWLHYHNQTRHLALEQIS